MWIYIHVQRSQQIVCRVTYCAYNKHLTQGKLAKLQTAKVYLLHKVICDMAGMKVKSTYSKSSAEKKITVIEIV